MASIKIVGPLSLGETSDFFRTYKLLSGLRALFDWAEQTYKVWIERILAPLVTTPEKQK